MFLNGFHQSLAYFTIIAGVRKTFFLFSCWFETFCYYFLLSLYLAFRTFRIIESIFSLLFFLYLLMPITIHVQRWVKSKKKNAFTWLYIHYPHSSNGRYSHQINKTYLSVYYSHFLQCDKVWNSQKRVAFLSFYFEFFLCFSPNTTKNFVFMVVYFILGSLQTANKTFHSDSCFPPDLVTVRI